MRLLVSVRSAMEAEHAIAGGAEIVDAKEPAAGSIGQVPRETLQEIRRTVPPHLSLSTALGDVTEDESLARAFDAVSARVDYVKLGFRGLREARTVTRLVDRAVAMAERLPERPVVIAVAYADCSRAASLTPGVLAGLLAVSGAGGLLVDTCFKDEGSLFHHITPAELSVIAARLAADGKLLALGGGLDSRHVRRAHDTGAAILGVRGAVCHGGRTGVVAEDRVRALAVALGGEKLTLER